MNSFPNLFKTALQNRSSASVFVVSDITKDPSKSFEHTPYANIRIATVSVRCPVKHSMTVLVLH